jgi:hypothetical protein
MASTSTISQNIDPIAPAVPRIGWATSDGDGGTDGPIKTANTAKDGTGTLNLVFTAGANGSILYRIVAVPAGTNVASVMRVFINNGSAPTTADNNILYHEISLAATTLTEVAAQTPVGCTLGVSLPAGYRVYVVIGTTVSAGWRVMAEGGDY